MDQMTPPTAMTDPMADPAAATEQGGYTICIAVGGDGALSVAVEGLAAEAAESAGGVGEAAEAAEPKSQPAGSIKEALTLALAAYKDNGKMPDMQGQSDQFEQGFSSVNKGSLS